MILTLGLTLFSFARADIFPSELVITDPTPTRLSVCLNYGCDTVKVVGFRPNQWAAIKALFRNPPATAEQERDRLKMAIALIEFIVGDLAGTSQDKAGDLAGLGLPGQQDCIDESVNTSLYLTLLESVGLMRFHTVGDRASRGYFPHGYPHTTAVIKERISGKEYAVDSWFFDNGKPPVIIPLQIWKDGWSPPDSTAKQLPMPAKTR
ncbi:MAG: hypothetical protein WBX11_10380 [Thiobacillaceae bacterium]